MNDERCLYCWQRVGCWTLIQTSRARKPWILHPGGSARSWMACALFGMDLGSIRDKRSNGTPLPGGKRVSTIVHADSKLLSLTHSSGTGLPKDITLDGELWMARGTFDQTSQICRSTVRLGRLRTFKHHLQRDSMERQWLREQVGGKQASQERVRLLQQAQQALADSVDSASHSKPVEPKMKGWKALKRLKLSVRTAFCSPLGDTLRTKLAQSFLAALVGPAQVKSALASPDKMMSRQHKVVRRCTGCGKRLGNKKKSRCLSDPVPAADASKVSRAHADQNPLATPSPSLETSFVPTFRPTRSTAFASHVCRRNPKNSTEWNRIKFMVSLVVLDASHEY